MNAGVSMKVAEPGTIVGSKYAIRDVLGSGGMGVVYAGEHVELGHPVAIKLLHGTPDASSENSTAERLMREARATASLTSRHAVGVIDFGTDAVGSPYFVMELLDGKTVEDVLERSGPIRPDQAIAIVLQACDALAEAHAKGILHRDLKPSNLFLARTCDGGIVVKVLDFGIAKQIADSTRTREQTLTTTGKLLGTVTYMAPEQVRAERDLDARLDIWALGAILYEMVAGEPPFTGPTTTAVLARILADCPIPIAERCPNVGESLAHTIDGCLSKRREGRPTNIETLVELLRGSIRPGASPDSLEVLLSGDSERPTPEATDADAAPSSIGAERFTPTPPSALISPSVRTIPNANAKHPFAARSRIAVPLTIFALCVFGLVVVFANRTSVTAQLSSVPTVHASSPRPVEPDVSSPKETKQVEPVVPDPTSVPSLTPSSLPLSKVAPKSRSSVRRTPPSAVPHPPIEESEDTWVDTRH